MSAPIPAWLLLLSACITAERRDALWDHDGDGVEVPADCDDDDPEISPVATERCGDGVDQDCSGADCTIDFAADPVTRVEGALQSSFGYRLADLAAEGEGLAIGVGAPYWSESGVVDGAVVVLWALDPSDSVIHADGMTARVTRYVLVGGEGAHVGHAFGLVTGGEQPVLAVARSCPLGELAGRTAALYLHASPSEADGGQVDLDAVAVRVDGPEADPYFGQTLTTSASDRALIGSYDADAWLLSAVSTLEDGERVESLVDAGLASRLDEEAGGMRATSSATGSTAAGEVFFVIGAFEADGEALANEGTVYLVREDDVVAGQTWSLADSTRLYGGEYYANAGWSVSVGDDDGDGHADLAIGGGYEGPSERAWVVRDVDALLSDAVSGRSGELIGGGSVADLRILLEVGGDESVDVQFAAGAGGGDQDALLLAAHGADPLNYPAPGAVTLLEGGQEGSLTPDATPPPAGVAPVGSHDWNQLGSSLLGVGDLNEDGYGDFLVGASQDGARESEEGTGAVFLYLGGEL